MHVTSNVKSCSTESRGSSPCLDPIPLHRAKESQCCHCNSCAILLSAEWQLVRKAIDVHARVHRPVQERLVHRLLERR